MNRNRVILIVVTLILVVCLYMFPKVSVNEHDRLNSIGATDSVAMYSGFGVLPDYIQSRIEGFNSGNISDIEKKKNATFVDSLANLYRERGFFDSVAWFLGGVAIELKSEESLLVAGNSYYEAYTFATEKLMQQEFAKRTRECLEKVLENNPNNLDAKSKVAMTYMSSHAPMKGVAMLKEVVEEDSINEFALYNLGMLSLQSGQYEKSISWMKKLTEVNGNNIQAQILLGLSYMKSGKISEAILQFELVKAMDKSPDVQTTVNSYLQELK